MHRPLKLARRHPVRLVSCLGAAALTLAPPATKPARAQDPVSFLETYDDFAPTSEVVLRLDLNGDGFGELTVAEAPVRGRIDVAMTLDSPAPDARVLAMRILRLTLSTDEVFELVSEALAGYIYDVSLHMGDGLGRPGNHSVIGRVVGGTNTLYTQFPTKGSFALRGTARAIVPDGFYDYVDLEFEELPVGLVQNQQTGVLSGGWERPGDGSTSRFNLRSTFRVPATAPLPVGIVLEITVEQEKPFGIHEPPTTYAQWAASFGLDGPDANPNADPDGDRLDNLGEYGTGRHPLLRDTEPAAFALNPGPGGRPALGFTRLANRSDLVYHFQVSRDLTDWRTIATSTTGAYAGGSNGGFVTAESSIPGSPGAYAVIAMPPAAGPVLFGRVALSLAQ
jgi:hypothetical protein